jgi:hypothetical protein
VHAQQGGSSDAAVGFGRRFLKSLLNRFPGRGFVFRDLLIPRDQVLHGVFAHHDVLLPVAIDLNQQFGQPGGRLGLEA